MKVLIIARHAKSDWEKAYVLDFDRGLSQRGKLDLRAMSKIISQKIQKPDLIIASPAKRTKKTAEVYATARGYKKKKIQFDHVLYTPSLPTVISCIERTPEKVQTLMVVGHVRLTTLINACGYTLENLPTCGVVVFQYTGKLRGNFEQKKCVFHEIFSPKQEQI